MPKTFYIIDGHAQIFRAYFAPFRDLSSPTGEPTKATYVFSQRLMNLIEDRKPDYLAMVIDSGDETVFRKEFYPEYKSHRKPTPDDFRPQAERILRIVKDAGIPIFVKPGFEADDLMATMAKQLEGQGFETYLVTNDKDIRQVIRPSVFMYDVYKDIVIDEKRLMDEHGYTPKQAIEIQTLIGDSTDNVPGIPGVGPKTALKLIEKYGTADAVLNHLEDLTPKMRESFEQNAAVLPLSRRLVTLRDDVEFDFDATKCQFSGLNRPALVKHFSELGFNAMVDKLEGGSAAKRPVSQTQASNGNGGKKLENAAAVVFDLFSQAADAEASMPMSTLTSNQVARPKANRYQPLEQGLFGPMGGDAENNDSSAEGNASAGQDEYATSKGLNYQLVNTEEKFIVFVDQLKQVKKFAFDTETDDLGAMKSNMIGMSFSWQAETGFYVPVIGPIGSEHLSLERVLKDIKLILEDENVGKVGHNIKYDVLVMKQIGVTVRGVVLDTMIAAFLLDASRNQYGIDGLALSLLKFKKIPTTDLIGKGKSQLSMAHCPLEQVAQYASEDADITWRLAERFGKQLEEMPDVLKLNQQVEVPLIDVLVEMESNGIAIDPAILKEQSKVLSLRSAELREKIQKEAGVEFNPDSPKQLGEVLYGKLGLKVVKKTKSGPSTDVEALEKLAGLHPVPELVLEYRSLEKLINTYLDSLTEFVNPKTNRIHASFNQIGASSGRLSCSDPNLQNIPIRSDEGRRIRLAFVPGDPVKNVLMAADYSQIELRILAHLTHEPALVKAFDNDEDIHQAVAAEVFNVPLPEVSREQRASAKIINFGIIYGVTAHGLARRIEGMNRKGAEDLIRTYHARFPAIKGFFDACVMKAQSQGYVETILGRRRPIPEVHSAIIAMRNYGERLAINSVVQGSAADLIKMAMINIHKRLQRENSPTKMLVQVHDELVFETPIDGVESAAAMVSEEMNSAMKLIVPLKTDVHWGKNWGESK